MNVHRIETRHRITEDWNSYPSEVYSHFVKVVTDGGIVGWSEYGDDRDEFETTQAIERAGPIVASSRVAGIEHIEQTRRLIEARASRSLPRYVAREAGAAIENALLDARAKQLGVSCSKLLGGPTSDRVRVYWAAHSNCWVVHPSTSDGLKGDVFERLSSRAATAREEGFSMIEVFASDERKYQARPWSILAHREVYRWGHELADFEYGGYRGFPAFKRWRQKDMQIELSPPSARIASLSQHHDRLREAKECFNDEISYLRQRLEALRNGAGPDMDIALDLTECHTGLSGLLQVLQALADVELAWVWLPPWAQWSDELPGGKLPIGQAANLLKGLRKQSPHQIAVELVDSYSDERLAGAFLSTKAVDITIIDPIRQGALQSLRHATIAGKHGIEVVPLDCLGALATMVAAHLSTALPNRRIMGSHVHSLARRRDVVNYEPEFQNGCVLVPGRPGWGTEPVEAELVPRSGLP